MDGNLIYLVQSDTVAGLHSQNDSRLFAIKQRDTSKPFIKIVDSFKKLKKLQRVPVKYKTKIRRSSKTTFVYSNTLAIRVSKDKKFNEFLSNFEWLYSSSANLSGKEADFVWAISNSDIIVNEHLLRDSNSSKILKINNFKIKRLR